MKKGKTYVELGDILKIVKQSALDIQDKAGFIKCIGKDGRRLYVAKNKRVGRIDVSGFESSVPGVMKAEHPHGKVGQEVDFYGRTKEEIVSTLRALVREAAGRSRVGPQAHAPAMASRERHEPRTGRGRTATA